jgi:hypothetical protein
LVDTFADGTVSPWVFLQKRDLYAIAMSQVSYKERTKTIMSTKNWTSKVRI